ncbi:MAG TPA: N-acetylmuramoyl-L-alanine amidase [Coleofasciculaceae cyanobacterium]
MGRIFISAGHGAGDPGIKVGDTTEAQEMILLRHQILTQLRDRGFQNSEVLSVPDNLSISQTIQWINERRKTGDVAVEIHAGAFTNPDVKGATVYYIALNNQRQKHAELLLRSLLDAVPGLSNRGAKPDTAISVKGLPFCRVVSPPSLLLEVAFLTNPEDRSLLLKQRDNFAQGIADGLAEWSRAVSGTKLSYPQISVILSQKIYKDKGILLSGNAYIPNNLLEEPLGIDLLNARLVRRVQYQGVIYVRAIDLQNYNILVSWDSANRTVILQSSLNQKIIGQGKASAEQLFRFLKANNSSQETVDYFSDLPKLYIEEAQQEGVNYDIAFCQMCVETNYLRFSDDIKPSQNNFGGLASATGTESATFDSARLGVRAHIQHLKAYGSKEGIYPESKIVDPRFRFVAPGSAPTVEELTGRWSAKQHDPPYGTKILNTLRSLYKSVGLL